MHIMFKPLMKIKETSRASVNKWSKDQTRQNHLSFNIASEGRNNGVCSGSESVHVHCAPLTRGFRFREA